MQFGYDRVFGLDAYARSFSLAQTYERRGDRTKAGDQYARFVDLWGAGEVEREWVADARRKLARQ